MAQQPLTAVAGIGDATARRLRESGIASVADLVAAGPDRLAVLPGFSAARAAAVLAAAQMALGDSDPPGDPGPGPGSETSGPPAPQLDDAGPGSSEATARKVKTPLGKGKKARDGKPKGPKATKKKKAKGKKAKGKKAKDGKAKGKKDKGKKDKGKKAKDTKPRSTKSTAAKASASAAKQRSKK